MLKRLPRWVLAAAAIVSAAACGGAIEVDGLGGQPSNALTVEEMSNIKVEHGYRAILGRRPDPAGRRRYAEKLATDTSSESFCDSLLGSDEFVRNRSDLSPTELGRELYRGILGREPDAGGLAATVEKIRAGQTARRAGAMLDGSEFSNEFLNGGSIGAGGGGGGGGSAFDILVTHAYRGILGREPDAGGLQGYVDYLSGGGNLEQVCASQFGSSEFADNRSSLAADTLTTELYRGILEREPDPVGLADTVNEILAGRSVARAAQMLESEEFKNRFLPPEPGDCSTDAAVIVAADLPTEINCGWSYNASVTIQNSGGGAWTRAAGYKLGTVDDSDPFFATTRIQLPEGLSVRPGETHTFNISLRAPRDEGTYISDWRMVHEGQCWFGAEATTSVAVTCLAGGEPIAAVSVHGNTLEESSTGWRGLGLGISLFYAPSVPWSDYTTVIDELSAAGIDLARFAGSTLGWQNDMGRPEVIPFKPGRNPYYPDDPDVGGYTNQPDPAFFDELDRRLDYAASHGVRVQYTVFWGSFKPMFVSNGALRRSATRSFVQYVANRFKSHPEHTLELINEADHGHHMASLGRSGRIDAIRDMARWVREVYPSAVLCVSDGGRAPDFEGAPYFDYHEIAELDYWNVHFPRDRIEADGIPRWARGPWHLYGDRNEFALQHPGEGYGRNDENIFLQTEAEHQQWPYSNSTRDWRMYANMMYVTLVGGVGFTLHNQKGFFVEPGVSIDPVFEPIRAMLQITAGFPWGGARSYNTSWAGSPLREFDGSFKAFVIVNNARDDMIIHVLNPAGTLTIDLDHAGMHGVAYNSMTGAQLRQYDPPAGVSAIALPAPGYQHGMTLRFRK